MLVYIACVLVLCAVIVKHIEASLLGTYVSCPGLLTLHLETGMKEKRQKKKKQSRQMKHFARVYAASLIHQFERRIQTFDSFWRAA